MAELQPHSALIHLATALYAIAQPSIRYCRFSADLADFADNLFVRMWELQQRRTVKGVY